MPQVSGDKFPLTIFLATNFLGDILSAIRKNGLVELSLVRFNLIDCHLITRLSSTISTLSKRIHTLEPAYCQVTIVLTDILTGDNFIKVHSDIDNFHNFDVCQHQNSDKCCLPTLDENVSIWLLLYWIYLFLISIKCYIQLTPSISYSDISK